MLVLGGLAVASLTLFAAPFAGARAAITHDPGEFLVWLKDQAIGQLTDEAIPERERKQRFRILFKENFDLPTISRFVLGRYWRKAQPNVREDFMSAFEDVMVQRFAPMFAGYKDTKFEIEDVRPLKNEGQFVVSSTILPTEGEAIKVDWRIRTKDGRHQVLDVIGEGVSMALTLRSEYVSVIKNSGGRVEGLVTQLRQRSASGDGPQTSENTTN